MTDAPPPGPAEPTEPTPSAVPAGEAHEVDHIVGISFDKPSRAEEALLTVVHLQQEGQVALTDAVVAIKDEQGKVHIRQTVDPTPGRAALGSSIWGLLLGSILGGPVGGLVVGGAFAGGAALSAKLVDLGLDDGWVKEVATWLDPGTSALLLLVSGGATPTLLAELKRYEGTVIYCTFPGEVRAELERTASELPPAEVDADQR